MSNYLKHFILFAIMIAMAVSVHAQKTLSEITIEIKKTELYLNGKVTTLPVKADDVYESFGKPDRTVKGEVRLVSVWENLGLLGFQNAADGDFIEIDLIFDVEEIKFEFTPAKPFRGQFILNGVKVDQNSTRDSINRRRKVGNRFTVIIHMMSDLTIGDLYLVLLQQDKKPYGSAKLWQLAISEGVK